MRILVCGGRDFSDHAFMRAVLCDDFALTAGEDVIVHGDAVGADRLAGFVARSIGVEVEAHPADWKKHGKAAGPIRNQEMLDTGVDVVLAFPGGKGTADMVRRAEKAGVQVILVSQEA